MHDRQILLGLSLSSLFSSLTPPPFPVPVVQLTMHLFYVWQHCPNVATGPFAILSWQAGIEQWRIVSRLLMAEYTSEWMLFLNTQVSRDFERSIIPLSSSAWLSTGFSPTSAHPSFRRKRHILAKCTAMRSEYFYYSTSSEPNPTLSLF